MVVVLFVLVVVVRLVVGWDWLGVLVCLGVVLWCGFLG